MVQKPRRDKTSRMVMCRGDWPEDNNADFEVFNVFVGESDEEAIVRAGEAYRPTNEFYIRD